jgi:hypothetical protein
MDVSIDSLSYVALLSNMTRRAGTPLKCYNGHKNWLLGWYQNKRLSVSGSAKVRLAALVDSSLAGSNEYVLLNVQNKIFLQYNRAKKHNLETGLAKDEVTVTVPLNDGRSNQDAALKVGESYSGGGTVIRVCSAETTANGADVVVVAIGRGC